MSRIAWLNWFFDVQSILEEILPNRQDRYWVQPHDRRHPRSLYSFWLKATHRQVIRLTSWALYDSPTNMQAVCMRAVGINACLCTLVGLKNNKRATTALRIGGCEHDKMLNASISRELISKICCSHVDRQSKNVNVSSFLTVWWCIVAKVEIETRRKKRTDSLFLWLC